MDSECLHLIEKPSFLFIFYLRAHIGWIKIVWTVLICLQACLLAGNLDGRAEMQIIFALDKRFSQMM